MDLGEVARGARMLIAGVVTTFQPRIIVPVLFWTVWSMVTALTIYYMAENDGIRWILGEDPQKAMIKAIAIAFAAAPILALTLGILHTLMKRLGRFSGALDLEDEDAESARKDEELARKDEEIARKDEELARKDEEIARLRKRSRIRRATPTPRPNRQQETSC